MKLPNLLTTVPLLAIASALPQTAPVAAVNLTDLHLQCYARDADHPKVLIEDCQQAFAFLQRSTAYWDKQQWNLFRYPLLLIQDGPCSISLDTTSRPDDRFSLADINARAFYVVSQCSMAPKPRSGGTVTIGALNAYSVDVTGVASLDQKDQAKGIIFPVQGVADS